MWWDPRPLMLGALCVMTLAPPVAGCGHRPAAPAAAAPPPPPAVPSAAPPPPTLTGTRIAATAAGALVIDADSGALFAIDRDGRATAQVPIARDAGLLAHDPVRGIVFVADRGSDRLVVVDARRMVAIDAWPTPAEPFGVALTPDRATVLVTTIADRTLIALDARSGAEQWRAALSREPRGVAVSPGGTHVLVSSIATGALDDVALAAPHPVTTIPFDLECDRCEPGTVFARGSGGVIFLDAHRAVASFQREVPESSFVRTSGYGGAAFAPPVTHHLAFLSFPDHGLGAPIQAVAQVAQHQPRALVWDPGGDALYVAGLGSDSLLHLPGLTRATTDGVEASASDAVLRARGRCGPDGFAITADRDLLVVRRMHGTGLARSQVETLVAYLEALPPPRTPTRDPAAVARGRDIFDNAGGCTTCHEGTLYTDGALHTFTGMPTAADTPSLIGLAASAPYFHDGSAETLDDLLRGFGTARDMADLSSLTLAQREDLKAFLETR